MPDTNDVAKLATRHHLQSVHFKTKAVPIRPPAQMTAVNLPDNYPWLSVTHPYTHQVAAGAWRRGCGFDRRLHMQCAFEMGLGTGKTLCVVEEILKLRSKAGAEGVRVLVLAPNAILRTVWEKQLAQHSGKQLKVAILDGTMSERRVLLRSYPAEVFVHNIESIPAMHEALARDDWDLVVIDEHSKFRTPKSSRSKALNGVTPFKKPIRGRYKIALSGTPVIKKPSDVYTIYRWLGAPFYSATAFRTSFSVMGGYGNHTELGANEHSVDRLNHILDQYRFVVPKDCVINIPRVPMRREVEMPPWQRALYHKVQEQLRTDYMDEHGDVESREIMNVLTEIMRLAQVTAGFEAIDKHKYNWRDDNAKAKELFGGSARELDEDSLLGQILDEDGCCILWCWYRAELIEIPRMCNERGISTVVYAGGMKPRERVEAESRFNEGKASVFVGQMAAAGLGLNLPTARTMVYVTRSFDTEAYIQSLDRNSRLTTTHQELQVVYLEAKDSIDNKIRQVIEGDIKMASQLTSIDIKSILGIK